MKQIKTALILTLLFLYGSDIFAWGKKGHEIVAEVAFSRLNPQTKTNILKYLNGLTIQQASTWMDDVRNDPAYRSLEKAHYINIPSSSNPETDVKRELEKTFEELKNKKSFPDSIIRIDILKLIHLIADVHQPLHTGYETDRGGNTILVEFNGKKSNLHRVWDSQIIEKSEIAIFNIENKITKMTKEERLKISNVNVELWIKETQTSLRHVYSMKKNVIDDNYISISTVIIEMQLAKAALRLQSALEKYFS